jgi:formate hydrogenlyase transcriptional activator
MDNSIRLLMRISTTLINANGEELAPHIRTALRDVAEFWGFKQLFLVASYNSLKEVEIIHSFVREGVPAACSRELKHLQKRLAQGLWSSKSNEVPDDCLYSTRMIHGKEIGRGVAIRLEPKGSAELILVCIADKQEAYWTDELKQSLCWFGRILAGAAERKKAAESMREILTFEQLLSDVSAKYINLPPDKVDKVMRNDLGRLAQLLEADRCIIYLVEEGTDRFRPHMYTGWWPEEDNDAVLRRNAEFMENPDFRNSIQYLHDKWRRGEHFQWNQLDRLPKEALPMKEAYRKLGGKSQLSVPISVAGVTLAVLTVGDTRYYRRWPEELIPRLRLFGEVFENALTRKKSEEDLRKALSEIKHLKERFQADYVYLRQAEMNTSRDFTEIVGKSEALRRILLKAKQVAPTDVNVLITGETGTGKGLIARAVHNASKRKDRPFMQVNCAALSPTIIESELFGHERGAFTGATERRIGRFEAADGTTLFLDEIGELPPGLQAKLLRVIQEGQFERVGGTTTLKTNVRIVAATNRDMETEVEAGRFRRDLWYRLNVFPIHVPPLRDRREDVALFVDFFVEKYSKWIGKTFRAVPRTTVKALQEYSWPGNIRELENLIERAVITSPEPNLLIEVPGAHHMPSYTHLKTLRDFERDYIVHVLTESGWKIKGRAGAANHLGLKPSTLRSRMERLAITRPALTDA